MRGEGALCILRVTHFLRTDVGALRCVCETVGDEVRGGILCSPRGPWKRRNLGCCVLGSALWQQSGEVITKRIESGHRPLSLLKRTGEGLKSGGNSVSE